MRTFAALIAVGLVAGCRPPPVPPHLPEVKRFEDVAQELGRPELAMHQLYRKTDPNHKPRIMMEPCNRLGAHDVVKPMAGSMAGDAWAAPALNPITSSSIGAMEHF